MDHETLHKKNTWLIVTTVLQFSSNDETKQFHKPDTPTRRAFPLVFS